MKSPSRWTIFVLAFATVVRLLALVAGWKSLLADPDAYRALATNLIAWGTFGTEQLPTAFRPPLYPLLLIPAVATGWDPLLIAALHLVLGVGTVWLTLLIGYRALGTAPAILAAVLVTVSPLLVRQSMLVMTETLATFLTTLTLWLLIRAQQSDAALTAHPAASPHRRLTAPLVSSALAGISAGLLGLCRPTFLLWILLIAVVLFFRELRMRRWPWSTVAYSLLVLLMLAPWMLRNWYQYGRPLAGTTHGGFTLLLGNNPEFYGHLRHAPRGSVWDASDFGRDWAQLLPRTSPAEELASNQRAYDAARGYMRHDPAGWARATWYRVSRLWGVLPLATTEPEANTARLARWLIATWYVGIYLLGLIAVLHWFRHTAPVGWVPALLLVAVLTAVHAFYWSDLRMRSPAEPLLALAAAAGASIGVNRKQSTQAMEA